MKNQKVDIKLGTLILIIIAITAGFFVWKVGKGMDENQSSNLIVYKEGNKKKDNMIQAEEFPIVFMRPEMKLENVIQQALFKKYPDWKNKNYIVNVSVEIDKESHAIGRFTYCSEHDKNSKGDGTWFASENNNNWILTDISYVGYNGTCQNFWKYNFPEDMIPDCWDNEKNIQVETKNPDTFYLNGITKKDKEGIIESFILFIKNEPYAQYYTMDNSHVLIIKNSEKYLKGMILRDGIENHSVPNFYAVKNLGKWNVVFNGHDHPSCNIAEKYNFPSDILGKCYDEINKQEKMIP